MSSSPLWMMLVLCGVAWSDSAKSSQLRDSSPTPLISISGVRSVAAAPRHDRTVGSSNHVTPSAQQAKGGDHSVTGGWTIRPVMRITHAAGDAN